MKLLLKLALCLSAVSVAWGQCGSGHFGLVAGQYWGCIPAVGAGNGTVTSIGLAGTANQITITGSTPITGAGSWTLSLPSTLLFPGTIQVTGLTTLAASTTGAASLNIPSGSAPTVPNSGDFWNQSGVLTFYDGSATQSLVYQSRQVGTSAPLSGGSALSANITLTCPTCTTSAASLTNNNLLIGNSGQGMAALGSLGTTTTLLHGNAAGAPTFGNVADGDFGTNLLGVAHGGTNLASGTSGGVLAFTGSTTLASSGALTANMPVIGGGAGVAPSVGTVTGNTTQFATSTGTQTSTAAVKIDASGNHIASGVTIDASNNVATPGSVTAGSGSAKTGYMSLQGATSGAQGFSVADVAGTSTLYLIPAATGSGNFLKDNGSTTCPTLPAGAPAACEQLAWAAPTGSGTVANSTSGQIPVYTAATTVTGGTSLTFGSGALSIGLAGSVQGSVALAGSVGGSTVLAAPTSGGGTLTLQAGSDTLVGRATTDTLTNKTFDTAGTGNFFKINGTAITDKTGTGKAVLDTSAVLTTPSVTTINDANGNPFIKSAATASAVDSVTITNAATANPATVEVDATGTDANINLALKSKGTGTVQLGGSSATVDSSGNLTVASCSGCGSVTAPTMLTWSPWGFGNGTAATVGGAIAAGANFGSVMSFYAPGPIKLSEIDVQVAVASGTACTGGTCGLIFGIATPPTTAAGTFTMLCVTSVATSGGSPDINTPGIIRVNMSSGSDVTAGTCSLPAGFYDLLIATDSIALKLTNFSNGGTSGAGNINQKYPWTFAASGAAISTGNGGALAFNGSITGTNVRSSAGSASTTIFEVGFNF